VPTATTLDEFFAGKDLSRQLFDGLRAALGRLGPAEMRVTMSQVAFRRARAFAWAWTPDRYLHGDHAPIVLTLSLPRRDRSKRWKEVVEPSPGRFMHHLELRSVEEIDEEVIAWLTEAWCSAG
jgi:hypothetical protein